jgi:hypothetical protein
VLGFRLSNKNLILWFNLISNPNEIENDWYAGSFTSVQFDGKELLDPFRAEFSGPFGQQKEKRSMQIDNIIIDNKYKVDLFNKPYHMVNREIGTVKATVTIASPKIEIDTDAYQLFREISLYPLSTYVVERLYLLDSHGNYINFSANYYSFISFGVDTEVKCGEESNYFIISIPNYKPHASFGFTSNRKIDIHNFTHNESKWRISSDNDIATCIHYYMRSNEHKPFDKYLWRKWHKYIQHPLLVDVKGRI